MSPYLKITGITFKIWIITAVINAFLAGIYTIAIEKVIDQWYIGVPVIFLVSLFFALPGFFVFWIILLVACSKKFYERELFKTALVAGFILSGITALIFSSIIGKEIRWNKYVFMLLIIVSAIASTMLHFKYFKKIK